MTSVSFIGEGNQTNKLSFVVRNVYQTPLTF